MLEKKIKVVTYLRVACSDQASIFRKNEQLRELIALHKDEWEIVDQTFDYGMSGRKKDRPALNYVLELCKKREVDMVVTLDSYMLARDVLLYKEIYTTIKEAGVEIYIEELKKSIKENKERNSRHFVGNLCPVV